MSALRLLAVGLLAAGMAAGVRAEEKKVAADKEKLVGAWEVVKADEGAPPVGSVIAFAKDGTIKVTHQRDGKEETLEGTYTVEGDQLKVVIKNGDKENKHTVTIKKLTATEFVAENDKGKAAEFKRKK